MTTEPGHALADALRQAPDDTEQWQVYADWLTSTGDVRGQLVMWDLRMQDPGLPEAERTVLERDIAAVASSHRKEWLAGLVVPEESLLEWRHGFVVGVRLSWNDDALAFFEALVAHPVARLLTALSLSYTTMGAAGARALASSESLRVLSSLRMWSNNIGVAGARALAASDTPRKLTKLDLRSNNIGAGAKALAASETLRGCEVIHPTMRLLVPPVP